MERYFLLEFSDRRLSDQFFRDIYGLSIVDPQQEVFQRVISELTQKFVRPEYSGEISPNEIIVTIEMLTEFGEYLNLLVFKPILLSEIVLSQADTEISHDELRGLTIQKATYCVGLFHNTFLSESHPDKHMDEVKWIQRMRTVLSEPFVVSERSVTMTS